MQGDFHYYATYCAAYLAGYSHEESLEICYCAQLTDYCTRPFLNNIGGPLSAATSQLQLEMMDARTDKAGIADITRIWASFHFLPFDLYAQVPKAGKKYLQKYRLICDVNGPLVSETVKLAKKRPLQAAGVAMHVLADTWAHRYFAGTPSLVINNTDFHFYELIPKDGGYDEKKVNWRHSVKSPDDLENSSYTNTLFQGKEKAIMNLGHGRAGHLPDYSFARYKYLPAWGGYYEMLKDNPADYYKAFTQMVYAMRYLRGDFEDFERDVYDTEKTAPYEEEIKAILEIRQLDGSKEWKALGEKLSGQEIPDFDLKIWKKEYMETSKADKQNTFLGKFIMAALRQKTMVTAQIYNSGNKIAGHKIDFKQSGFMDDAIFKEYTEEKK